MQRQDMTNFGQMDDWVMLVTDKESQRYLALARMVGANPHEGKMTIAYADGILDSLSVSAVRPFIRLSNYGGEIADSSSQPWGPKTFLHTYLKLGGRLEQLAEQYWRLFQQEFHL
jgi:hypothetical protein